MSKYGAHLKIPDHLKKPKQEYVPNGKPRGRPKKAPGVLKEYVPTGAPRGRPKKKAE